MSVLSAERRAKSDVGDITTYVLQDLLSGNRKRRAPLATFWLEHCGDSWCCLSIPDAAPVPDSPMSRNSAVFAQWALMVA
ncbi:MAG: hypothetical protein HN348_11495 [Proteobacteria bacterium]|nr:hypothetical protein [Pseudomonadota bacterium]